MKAVTFSICLKGILEEFTLGIMPARIHQQHDLLGVQTHKKYSYTWVHFCHGSFKPHGTKIPTWLDLVCHTAKNPSIFQPLAKAFVAFGVPRDGFNPPCHLFLTESAAFDRTELPLPVLQVGTRDGFTTIWISGKSDFESQHFQLKSNKFWTNLGTKPHAVGAALGAGALADALPPPCQIPQDSTCLG